MPTDVVAVLRERGLHITEARQKILAAFDEKEGGICQREIQQFLNGAFDRVTIYRTLDLFVKKNIIHIIPSLNHVVRYALVNSGRHNGCYQNHLHFLCEDCGKTICLDTMPVPAVQLPEGFAGKATDMMVKGICSDCTGL